MKNDPDFGEIKFKAEHGYFDWEGERMIAEFGQEATQIIIESYKSQSITQQQREVFQLLIADYLGIQGRIKQKLFEYYQEMRKELLPIYDPEIVSECLPEIQSVAQVDRLISYPSIHLYQPKSDKVIFSMAYECVWDEEHGLGIRIEDWQVTNIGLYDAMWG